MENLDIFYPERMAQRILGMGDVVSLVEKAQEVFDEEEAKRLNQKIRKNQFNFEDFLTQLQQIKKMGSIKDIVGMLPGMNKMMKDVDIDDNAEICDQLATLVDQLFTHTPAGIKVPLRTMIAVYMRIMGEGAELGGRWASDDRWTADEPRAAIDANRYAAPTAPIVLQQLLPF